MNERKSASQHGRTILILLVGLVIVASLALTGRTDAHREGFALRGGQSRQRRPTPTPTPKPSPERCPNVTVRCAEGRVTQGGPVQFTAQISDLASDITPRYNWNVTAGSITSGQGTSVITVDTSGLSGQTLGAQLTVEFGRQCPPFVGGCQVIVSGLTAPACPSVVIECPTASQEEGAPLILTVHVKNAAINSSLEYRWVVSSGSIKSGQGTPTIVLDTSGLGGRTITALVEVQGFAPTCERTASCSFTVKQRVPDVTPTPAAQITYVPSHMIDSYGTISVAEENERLRKFAAELKKETGAKGHILAYGPRSYPNLKALLDELTRAKAFLVETLGIGGERVTTGDLGARANRRVELWLEPAPRRGQSVNTPLTTMLKEGGEAAGRVHNSRATLGHINDHIMFQHFVASGETIFWTDRMLTGKQSARGSTEAELFATVVSRGQAPFGGQPVFTLLGLAVSPCDPASPASKKFAVNAGENRFNLTATKLLPCTDRRYPLIGDDEQNFDSGLKGDLWGTVVPFETFSKIVNAPSVVIQFGEIRFDLASYPDYLEALRDLVIYSTEAAEAALPKRNYQTPTRIANCLSFTVGALARRPPQAIRPLRPRRVRRGRARGVARHAPAAPAQAA
jgi:hypothetical protein